MASFSTCFNQFVLLNEAGDPPRYHISPDPTKSDPNAKVCAGINSAAFPRDFAFIAALPEDQRPAVVDAFYQRVFWNTYLSSLNSNRIAAVVLDAMVNQGPGTGVKLLQRATGACGLVMTVDGLWGPVTVAAANSVPPEKLFPAFQQAREDAYRKIGGPNLEAWLARAAKVPNFD